MKITNKPVNYKLFANYLNMIKHKKNIWTILRKKLAFNTFQS
jgi:hypothetical protein